MASITPGFTGTHVLYLTPRGSPSMKPTEAYNITSYVTSSPGSKEFKSEVDEFLKNAVEGEIPQQPVFTSTKESLFSSVAFISTPSNPKLASTHMPLSSFTATIKFSDEEFHPDILVRQGIRRLSRTIAFVYNSREYKWKWDLWAPSKLVVESNGRSDTVALFYAKGYFLLGGVMVVDENKIDLSVAFITIVICLKRERQRRYS